MTSRYYSRQINRVARFAILIGCVGWLLTADPGFGQSASLEQARQLYQEAESSYAGINSYVCRMIRHSIDDGKVNEQILILYFRKNPWSVRFKWLSGDGQGREVLYVKDHYENKIHAITAPGDIPFVPGGEKLALSLDSPLVRSASPTPITESGIGALIDRFGKEVDRAEQGKEQIICKGQQQRPDYDVPLHVVEGKLPPGIDPDVPHGGRFLLGFHSELHLPVLSVLYNEVGSEVSYYRFDRLELNVGLTDADFDPAKMGPRKPAKTAR